MFLISPACLETYDPETFKPEEYNSIEYPYKLNSAKESKDCDEKDEDTSIPRDDSHSSILEACGISNSGPSKAHVINAEKLVFGATLSKHHVANIEVTFNYVLWFGC